MIHCGGFHIEISIAHDPARQTLHLLHSASATSQPYEYELDHHRVHDLHSIFHLSAMAASVACRDDEMRRVFMRDMALNHLPHLYHALRQIGVHLGLEIEDPPPVQFLELNGHGKGRNS